MALTIRVILRQFWRDEDMLDLEQAVELSMWLDVLAGVTVAEVRAAWADYQVTGPRSSRGTLHRPDAGAIRKRIGAERARAHAARVGELMKLANMAPPEPVVIREPLISDERRAEILREAGFGSLANATMARARAFPVTPMENDDA